MTRNPGDDLAPGLSGCPILPLGTCGTPSDVQQVAMTPRSARGMTPRPVVRGPQGGKQPEASAIYLTPEEDARAEKAFVRHDRMKVGEVDILKFAMICEDLDLPVDPQLADEWIGGRSEAKALNMDEFKGLYARILSAQSPAVRQVHTGSDGQTVRLPELVSTEVTMRGAFKRYAGSSGQLAVDTLAHVFQYLRFPDHHGDGFDRFVGEWLVLTGKEESGSLNFHEFVASVNLLIDFCGNQPQPAQTAPGTN